MVTLQCVVGYPRKSKRGLASRIIYGEEAVPNSIPWQVLVQTFQNDGGYICGGTIISHYHILSAAHCFHNKKLDTIVGPQQVKVKVGEHHVYREDGIETSFSVKCIAVHPSYQNDGGYMGMLRTIILQRKYHQVTQFYSFLKRPSVNFEHINWTLPQRRLDQIVCFEGFTFT